MSVREISGKLESQALFLKKSLFLKRQINLRSFSSVKFKFSGSKFFLLLVICATWALILPAIVPDSSSDRGIFISVGERLLAGDALYAQVYDNKEPLFYYLVALERSVPLGDFIAELLLLLCCSYSSYKLASSLGSAKSAVALGFVVVPLVLTGAFYLPGYTHLPGIALALAACAFCQRGWPVTAGFCIGALTFMKIPMAPVALVAIGCLLVERRNIREALALGGSAIACTIAILALLYLRQELWPFIAVTRANIAYSQGSLIESQGFVASVAEHLKRVGGVGLVLLLSGIGLGQLVSLIFMGTHRSSEALRAQMINVWILGLLALFSAILVLGTTGMWPHHSQVLYFPAIFTILGLVPFYESVQRKRKFIGVMLFGILFLLLGSAQFSRSVKTARHIPNLGLREIASETSRLLATKERGAYARLGQNDDDGHAYGLRNWQLLCPKFHHYYFDPGESLDGVLKCASQSPTLIVAASLVPQPGWRVWNDFVQQAEGLIANHYTCDATQGARVCTRKTGADSQ